MNATARALVALLLALASGAAADQCSQVTADSYACDFQRICSSCIVTSGCYFSLADLTCESTAAAPNASGSANGTTYCSDSDALCASCAVSAAQPTCAGAGGCICPSVCSVASELKSCTSASGSSINGPRFLLGFICMGIVIPLFMFSQIKLSERFGLRHMAQPSRMRPGQPQRRRRPPRDSNLVPSLDGWRQHLEEHKDALQDVELASCGYIKMDVEKPEAEADVQSSALSATSVQVASTEVHVGPDETHAAATAEAALAADDRRATMRIL